VQRPDSRPGIDVGGTNTDAAIDTDDIARFPGEVGD
jgi:N-methylhydantoinase A/oxoprolinase/acetone carboxylase beta subunit